MLQSYLPIVVLFVLAAGFAVGSVATAGFVGPKRYNRAKMDAYECGIEPTPQPMGGGRFPIKFYLTAMLFIIFDIEIIFLYPWAVAFGQEGGATVFLFVEMLMFIVFDIEIIFLYPWAVQFDALAFFGLVEMVIFIATVFVAYAYVWRRGGLEWD